MIESLKERVAADKLLTHRGRFVNTQFLLEVGDTPYLIRIENGVITSVTRGPFVMAHWIFALRAPEDAWRKFWSANPPPGFHDLFALIKQRLLKAEGDLHPFMANLFYFKGVLATLRDA
ncbi:MAG: hypothetical protein ABW199_07930 [Caulobacterales bacterium]